MVGASDEGWEDQIKAITVTFVGGLEWRGLDYLITNRYKNDKQKVKPSYTGPTLVVSVLRAPPIQPRII